MIDNSFAEHFAADMRKPEHRAYRPRAINR